MKLHAGDHRSTERRIRETTGVATGAGIAALLGAGPAEAAQFQVTSDSASGPGSLAAAVHEANQTSAADLITFHSSVTGRIDLNGSHLYIESPMTIRGPGASRLEVNAKNLSRAFFIETSPGTIVSISGLALRDGVAAASGGLIRSLGADLRLTGVTVEGGTADAFGGGIWASELALTDSVVHDNRATFEDGGGIWSEELEVTRSTISGNQSGNRGGGIHSTDLATISRSTVSGNETSFSGGGIYGLKSLSLSHSTISGNSANLEGGGVAFVGPGFGGVGALNVSGSTVVGNISSYGSGAGVSSEQSGVSDPVISSTILAGNGGGSNAADLGSAEDPGDRFRVRFSLVQDRGSAWIQESVAGSNLYGISPRLGPLRANGGPTRTHAPSLSSPVLDKGMTPGPISTDQRGKRRPFDLTWIPASAADGADSTDIGAVELTTVFKCRGVKVTRLGTSASEKIVGSRKRDVIFAAGGADRVAGRGGNDVICGGPGKDTLNGGAGSDALLGQGGRDRLLGGAGPDLLLGGPGRDLLRGGPGRDRQRQ